MARCSRRAMRPAAVMAAIYRATLAALLRSEWRDPTQRVSLSKPQKLWLVLRHGLVMTARPPSSGAGACRRAPGSPACRGGSSLPTAGRSVLLHEAAPHAGGRCRSYFDAELGCRIDNGNHLLLSGNRAALDYLERIGALDTSRARPEAVFPVRRRRDEQRWTVRPNRRRSAVVGFRTEATGAGNPGASIISPRCGCGGRRVGDRRRGAGSRRQSLFRRLWEPLAVAALNTGAEQASAALFWRILAETLGRGGAACRPLLPRIGLSETFVEPALARLRAPGRRNPLWHAG